MLHANNTTGFINIISIIVIFNYALHTVLFSLLFMVLYESQDIIKLHVFLHPFQPKFCNHCRMSLPVWLPELFLSAHVYIIAHKKYIFGIQ